MLITRFWKAISSDSSNLPDSKLSVLTHVPYLSLSLDSRAILWCWPPSPSPQSLPTTQSYISKCCLQLGPTVSAWINFPRNVAWLCCSPSEHFLKSGARGEEKGGKGKDWGRKEEGNHKRREGGLELSLTFPGSRMQVNSVNGSERVSF